MLDVVVGLSEGHCRAAREAGDAGPQPGDAHQHSTEGCERASTVPLTPPDVLMPLCCRCRKLIPPGLPGSNSSAHTVTSFVQTFLTLHLPAARRA